MVMPGSGETDEKPSIEEINKQSRLFQLLLIFDLTSSPSSNRKLSQSRHHSTLLVQNRLSRAPGPGRRDMGGAL